MRSIGHRRYRITFQQHDGTVDNHGMPTYSTAADWDAVVSSVPASKETVGGTEAIRGVRIDERTSHIFRCDWLVVEGNSVSSRMRIVESSNYYNIVSVVDPDGMRREAVIQAERTQ